MLNLDLILALNYANFINFKNLLTKNSPNPPHAIF